MLICFDLLDLVIVLGSVLAYCYKPRWPSWEIFHHPLGRLHITTLTTVNREMG